MEWPLPWYRNLWAPWRMRYIKGEDRVSRGCVLCEAPRMGDKEALIVYRGERAYVILNKYPYNSGHLMVVPYRHVPDIVDLDKEELAEMMELARASIRALREAFRPHGFNLGVNIGEAAGAGISGHVHLHVLPRWVGDTNYTMTFAGVKVIPQALEETWAVLKPIMEKLARGQ